MKREFLMLAQVYNPLKHHIAAWMMSQKLDGVRAFWDGGASRGLPASQVPWANTEKDSRYRKLPIATGLWSRYGNIIHAPGYFLDQLPLFPLDGELYIRPQSFQETVSTVKDIMPGYNWKAIRYAILDTPPIDKVFADGVINVTNFRKTLKGCVSWVQERLNPVAQPPEKIRFGFDFTYNWLKKNIDSKICFVLEQEKLSSSTVEAQLRVQQYLDEVLLIGGEGVILRRPVITWTPERSWDVLKFKPWKDAEGVVTGYSWGRETDKGSKLLGLMGNLILDYDGKRLELSGFTDAERIIHGPGNEGYKRPGEIVSIDEGYHNPIFPIGSTITFKYRELSRDGVPKEARYWRKRTVGV